MTDNKIILNDEMLREKYSSPKEMPAYIRVDASTFCQLKCPSCYMRKDTEGVKNGCGIGHLKFSDFRKLIDENPHLEKIELSNSGEPFLNPELADIIEYAFQHGVITSFTNGVNLNYLSDRQAETVVKCQVDTITVSIDGASQETYSQYRIGGNYEKVLDNVRKIIKFKKLYNSDFPYLNWKFIVFGHNEHEILKAKEDAKKLGVNDLIFDTNWDNVYSPIKDTEFVKRETGIDALDINVSPVVQLREYLQGKIEWYFCRDLWEPQINWDGKVLGCCANYKSDFGGNVFKDGLINALNNPKLIYAKNMVMNKAPAIEGIPCTTCWCYKAMKEADIWLTSPKDACCH